MRVIAGSARGLRLTAPAGMQTRPTADRVKEALFSIIASRRELAGARVLDICAGTGSLGIEALSRGPPPAVLLNRRARYWEYWKRTLSGPVWTIGASVWRSTP